MSDVQDQATGARGPIFIVGAKGSGTTLLRLILDSHPNIAVPQETGFARALMAQQRIPFWRLGGHWWRKLGYTDEMFGEHLRNFYEVMFLHYAQQHGKQRWGEKTPLHVWHIQRLKEVFPEAVFIALARHPGGNIRSLQTRFDYSVAHGIAHWTKANPELLHQAAELGDDFILCRYEDLVLQPEATLRELLEWLGEPWSPAVLEHHIVHSARGTQRQVEGRTRTDDPIDISRVSKWVDETSPQDLDLMARRTRRLASVYGYAPGEPVPHEPLGADGQLLLTGPQLTERLKSSQVRVDRPKPRLMDRPLNPRRVGLVAVRRKGAAAKKKRRQQAPAEPHAPQAARQQRKKTPPAPKSPPTLTQKVAKRIPPSVKARLREMIK